MTRQLPVVTTLSTPSGRADVLHRLALAVQCIDASTGQPIRTSVRIGREPVARLLAADADSSWPCLDLTGWGSARAVLRHGPTVSTTVVLRIADPDRRFVARRFRMPLWTLAEVEAVDKVPPGGPYVPARARLLRPWLTPGAGYLLNTAATAVRGRVMRAGKPVRWARLSALGPGNVEVGWAHGDERGEFVLLISGTGTMPPPAPSVLDVDLRIHAPAAPIATKLDRYADLPIEAVPQTSIAGLPAELDNPLLEGRTPPPGYLPSTVALPTLHLPVGSVTTLTDDVEFAA